ncbi:LPXTG-motif cell wall anchor domain-containing protein [Micromonospora nigra]|uniref:LPXTG-motif cell wall anchor domain-containing protein n=1 Tax=Micromonospora nigra TaxID=145857 RepID=A0A1C6SQB5_9ACTN|nr:LPXTG cell wall anchor domain-containing protein [Micromonospora nigra]SCL31469.1 LPXTG-motif cell wall anchor domain-containing protein [Micromonospora nigra]
MPQRRHVARAAVSTAAATACLALATPAWAGGDVPLHAAHRGSTAAAFQQECDDDRFATRPDDHDGWHFVLPGGNASGGFESLTLTFSDGDEQVTVTVPDSTDAYPDALYPAGRNSDRLIHAYLFTPAGWTLVDGTASVSGAADRFNLSHTCAGEGTPTTATPTPSESVSASPSPSTTPEATPSVTPSPSTGGGGGGDDDGGLPVTGAAATTMALVGAGLVGGGAALVAVRRRRDRVTFTS